MFVKLWVAAADDPDLYARLVPLEREVSRADRRRRCRSSGARSAPEDLAARVTTALATMRGLALSRAYEPTGRRQKNPWPHGRPMLERLLTDP